jgi:thiazole tautomerase (transcriptional regulator TenI)
VIAIGGIVPETISKLSGVKLCGVAVMSYVMASDDPNRALLELKGSIGGEGHDEKTI